MPADNNPNRAKNREPELPGLESNSEKTVAQQALERMQGQVLGISSSRSSFNKNSGELAYDDTVKSKAADITAAKSTDEPAEKPANKPSDKSADSGLKNLKVTDEMRNAIGAYVQKDALGRTALIVRKDNTAVIPHWKDNTNELIGFDESRLGSDQKRSWIREGDAFKWTGPDGKQHTLKNVEIDKNNNGNFSFTFAKPGADGKPKDTSLIIRGNGAQVPKDENGSLYTFDAEGRLFTFQPTMENHQVMKNNQAGESSLKFSYIDKTLQVNEISEIKSGKTITEKHSPKPGEVLVDNGNSWDLKYPETIKMGPTDYPITRVHRLGNSPTLDDRQKEFAVSDGSKTVTRFGANGSFISVDGYSKEGRLLKTYAIGSTNEIEDTNKTSGNKPESNIIKLRKEIDHINGNTTSWGSKDGLVWHGKQIKEHGKEVNKDKDVRYNLHFDNLASLKYIDKSGASHTEFKDGKAEVLRFMPNDTYSVSDEGGRVLKAGVMLKDANAKPLGPDLKNYVAYKYDTRDGKSIITEADFIQNGEVLKDKAWTPEMGKDAALLPNGELRYLKNEKEKVVTKPDQSTSTFLIGKDAASDLLSEVRFPDGSKRSFVYGNPPDKRHPVKIESSFKNPNGDTVVIKVDAEAKEPTNTALTKLDDLTKWTPDDFRSVMQYWKTTGNIIPKDVSEKKANNQNDTNAGQSSLELEPAFALELFDNGTYELTPTGSMTNKERIEFSAAKMATFPTGRPVEISGEKGRLPKAGKYNTDAYLKHVFPKQKLSMPSKQQMQLEDGREPIVVDTKSIPKDESIASRLALKYMAADLKQTIKRPIPADPKNVPAAELHSIQKDMAYVLEESGAIIEGIAQLKTQRAK